MNRAIIELSELIQPGDVLVLFNGSRDIAAGTPVNTARYRRGEYWIVSVHVGTCYLPVGLNAVHQVERSGVIIWRIEDERAPIQQRLFA